MRWFIVFLLIANIVLFLWVQQDALNAVTRSDIPPPDIGNLRLLNEVVETPSAAVSVAPTPTEAEQGDVVEDTRATVAPPASTVAASDPAPATDPPSPQPRDEPQVVEVAERVAAQVSEPQPPTAADDLPQQLPVPGEEPAGSSPPDLASQKAMEPVADASEPTAVITPSCARVGPLPPADAEQLLTRLPGHLTLLSDTSEEAAKVDGYYVLIPPLANRSSGLAKLEELRVAGFEDTWLFRRGAFRHAISLGLFKRKSSAERHAAAVAKKGFNVEIREKTSQAERRWLQIKDPGGGELSGSLPLPKGVALEPADCPPQ